MPNVSLSVRLQEVASELAGSAFQLAAEVSAAVQQKLAPMLEEGEKMPDLGFVQQLVGRYLKSQGVKAVAAEVRHKKARVMSRNVSALRTELMAKLRARLRDVRYVLDRQFGAEASRRLIEERNFSQTNVRGLVKLARQALEILRDPNIAWNSIAAGGLTSSSSELADAMEAEVQQLQELLDGELKARKRDRQVEQRLKGEELSLVNQDNVGGASLLAGLYIFAGLPFHAQRLRVKIRRRGEEPEKEAAPMGEAGESGEKEMGQGPVN